MGRTAIEKNTASGPRGDRDPVRLAMRMIGLDRLAHLFFVFRSAVFLWPLDNLRAIIGRFRDLGRPSSRYSELNMLQLRRAKAWRDLFHFLLDVAVLAIPTRLRSRRLYAQRKEQNQSSEFVQVPGMMGYGHEAWFYLNGVATNREMARDSGLYLAEIFRRPITVLPNHTKTLLPDLIQVTAQKGFGTLTRAGRRARDAIARAMLNVDRSRVIVIAHSQGAVIIAAVLRALGKYDSLKHQHYRKLEIYTFGNPADGMRAHTPLGHMEHFANGRDLVARLGVLATAARSSGKVQIDGDVFVCERFGHFFNEHYVHGLELRAFSGEKEPRLYAYLNGGIPV